MNQDYLNKVENLKKDFEQFAEKDIDVKMVVDNEQGIVVSCTVNSNLITIELEDKELEAVVNEAIKLAGLEYNKRRKIALSTLNKRAVEIVQPFKDIARDLDGA